MRACLPHAFFITLSFYFSVCPSLVPSFGLYVTNFSTLEACAPGHFCPGDRLQHPCSAGAHANNASSTSCLPCTSCPVGQGVSSPCVSTQNTRCIDCGSNECSIGGSSNCQTCPENYVSNEGQSACLPCEPGTYRDAAFDTCQVRNYTTHTHTFTLLFLMAQSSASLGYQIPIVAFLLFEGMSKRITLLQWYTHRLLHRQLLSCRLNSRIPLSARQLLCKPQRNRCL